MKTKKLLSALFIAVLTAVTAFSMDVNKEISRYTAEQQILIKTYSGIADFGDCLRVSTGRKEAMEQFLAGLEAVDK